ncbi:hypothetical protein FA95DRAFT_1614409 [Auriscalpium vulgare]|uniref:Uncharacterized protein n=1 Tax=Auriscalpium vulgare TaxID=40419 RepID=A0ACB8R0G4_9AGAM|nr:hypothetical protein FA95DRAFT_1614409 [Auriscalpium vulgare]
MRDPSYDFGLRRRRLLLQSRVITRELLFEILAPAAPCLLLMPGRMRDHA